MSSSKDPRPKTFRRDASDDTTERDGAYVVLSLAERWAKARMERGDHPHDAMMDAHTILEAYLATEIDGEGR